MARDYKQGIYKIKNRKKYIGKKDPRFLSSYEERVFRFLDNHDGVIKWGAEVVVVPYFNPIKGKRDHEQGKKVDPTKPNSRYIVDVYVKYYDKHGDIHEELIEIKPYKEAEHVINKKPTKKGRKKQSTFDREMETAIVNEAKWIAAKKFVEARGMKFRVMTERQIWL